MNRISIHPASALIGLAFGVLVLVSMSQTTVSKDPWPPAKHDIVNVFSPYDPNAGLTQIPPGTSLTVYTVPNNQWLTITGAHGESNSAYLTYWSEDLAGTITRMGGAGTGVSETGALYYSPVSSGGPIGWTFRPGSSVVMRNEDPTNIAQFSSYGFIGYLSRE